MEEAASYEEHQHEGVSIRILEYAVPRSTCKADLEVFVLDDGTVNVNVKVNPRPVGLQSIRRLH